MALYSQTSSQDINNWWLRIRQDQCNTKLNKTTSTKFIYPSKIHLNQSINCLLMEEKKAIDYSQTTDVVYENSKDYNPSNKRKVLIVFDDMIVDMEANKKSLIAIVTEVFLRGRKLNISPVFISQSYFIMPKIIRLNMTYYFIMKITNKEISNK